MSSPIDGYWRGYYQTIDDQMAGKKNHFKMRFVSTSESNFQGEMLEKVVILGVLAGRIEGNAVHFTRQIRTDVPRSVFAGTIDEDGSLSGQCQIGSGSGTRSGTWHAERYQPSALESFFDGTRRASIIVLLVAAATFYFGIFEPITLAQAQEEKIAVNSQFVMIMAVCGPMGIVGLIFGEKVNKFLKEDLVEKKSVKGWIIIAAHVLLGLGLYHWLLHYLGTLGYVLR